jgi:hypothetical protein
MIQWFSDLKHSYWGSFKWYLHRQESITYCRHHQQHQYEKIGNFLLKSCWQATWSLWVYESLNTDIKSLGDVISSENFPSFQITTANLSGNIYCILACVSTTSAIINWHFQKLTRSHCLATGCLCVCVCVNL